MNRTQPRRTYPVKNWRIVICGFNAYTNSPTICLEWWIADPRIKDESIARNFFTHKIICVGNAVYYQQDRAWIFFPFVSDTKNANPFNTKYIAFFDKRILLEPKIIPHMGSPELVNKVLETSKILSIQDNIPGTQATFPNLEQKQKIGSVEKIEEQKKLQACARKNICHPRPKISKRKSRRFPHIEAPKKKS